MAARGPPLCVALGGRDAGDEREPRRGAHVRGQLLVAGGAVLQRHPHGAQHPIVPPNRLHHRVRNAPLHVLVAAFAVCNVVCLRLYNPYSVFFALVLAAAFAVCNAVCLRLYNPLSVFFAQPLPLLYRGRDADAHPHAKRLWLHSHTLRVRHGSHDADTNGFPLPLPFTLPLYHGVRH